ncbi:uncharacterized protein BT62DRAFT_965002 [Guyanagaster necrorhizus]|uniref:DUF829-domain-containing protein n=1 Tax=Guyanagaster necrorhizus TaxID=856835 RepID=A0A9P7VX50_9AGAR|nr:uncharacterized protein BT62DRAFT_965002 [Guyanagaster necrorhizus MCA 3950]KAG7448569.1 hypothetical protein BT62DRAFT_965002 [Guyanagaster necrorhizus MCA 3950]
MSSQEESEFIKLGADIYLRKANEEDAHDKQSPNIILVCGWMGAQLRHIHKYTKVYEQVYPGATQILIQNRPSFFWSTENTRRKVIAPAVEVLEALGTIPPQSPSLIMNSSSAKVPRILVHSFSNGGAYSLITLGKIMASRAGSSSPLKSSRFPCAIVLDSSPGGSGLSNAIHAFTTLIKNPITRVVAKVLVCLLYVYGFFVGPFIGRRTALQKVRDGLYNPRVLPWVDERTPRLYMYSRADDMVPWEQIREHAERTKSLGWNVRTEIFEDSPHVAHARTHPEQYWGAVKRLWDDALDVAHTKEESN